MMRKILHTLGFLCLPNLPHEKKQAWHFTHIPLHAMQHTAACLPMHATHFATTQPSHTHLPGTHTHTHTRLHLYTLHTQHVLPIFATCTPSPPPPTPDIADGRIVVVSRRTFSHTTPRCAPLPTPRTCRTRLPLHCCTLRMPAACAHCAPAHTCLPHAACRTLHMRHAPLFCAFCLPAASYALYFFPRAHTRYRTHTRTRRTHAHASARTTRTRTPHAFTRTHTAHHTAHTTHCTHHHHHTTGTGLD